MKYEPRKSSDKTCAVLKYIKFEEASGTFAPDASDITLHYLISGSCGCLHFRRFTSDTSPGGKYLGRFFHNRFYTWSGDERLSVHPSPFVIVYLADFLLVVDELSLDVCTFNANYQNPSSDEFQFSEGVHFPEAQNGSLVLRETDNRRFRDEASPEETIAPVDFSLHTTSHFWDSHFFLFWRW